MTLAPRVLKVDVWSQLSNHFSVPSWNCLPSLSNIIFSQLSVEKFRLITLKVSCDSNILCICMSEVPEDEWVTPEGVHFRLLVPK